MEGGGGRPRVVVRRRARRAWRRTARPSPTPPRPPRRPPRRRRRLCSRRFTWRFSSACCPPRSPARCMALRRCGSCPTPGWSRSWASWGRWRRWGRRWPLRSTRSTARATFCCRRRGAPPRCGGCATRLANAARALACAAPTLLKLLPVADASQDMLRKAALGCISLMLRQPELQPPLVQMAAPHLLRDLAGEPLRPVGQRLTATRTLDQAVVTLGANLLPPPPKPSIPMPDVASAPAPAADGADGGGGGEIGNEDGAGPGGAADGGARGRPRAAHAQPPGGQGRRAAGARLPRARARRDARRRAEDRRGQRREDTDVGAEDGERALPGRAGQAGGRGKGAQAGARAGRALAAGRLVEAAAAHSGRRPAVAACCRPRRRA